MKQAKWHWHALLPTLRHTWNVAFGQPFWWLFLCFFQPARFHQELEYKSVARRCNLLLRLALPLFLLCLLLALPVQILLSSCVQACTSLPASFFSVSTLYGILLATLFGVGCGLAVGVLGDVSLGIILAIALGITGIVLGNVNMGLAKGVAVALTIGLVGGTARGLQWARFGWVEGSIMTGLSWTIPSFITQGITTGVAGGILVALAFFTSYTLGYYRLLLYLASGPSGLWAYSASRKNPSAVFAYLHHSSLYWDECSFLPLPYLQQLLLIAVGQDMQQALAEIAFIMDQRPQQRQAALTALFEIALRDMEGRETLRDIAKAAQRLKEILPHETALVNSHVMTPFIRLADASREAARYAGPLSWHNRRAALEEMLATLEKIYPNTAFPETRLNILLGNVVTKWRTAVRYQQEQLEQGTDPMGQIMNPYNPGNTLRPEDTLFVGRRDIVRQLTEALSKKNRPTFLLNGERRMGKSSLLRQLPTLLGASYIPVFYDLQDRGISSSIDVFLQRLAEQIYKDVSMRGISIAQIERASLREALNRNEAAVYHLFDEWLDEVERTLQREQRIVLLLFDEFEKLEEADAAGYLTLTLLLDWFRKTIQNRSSIAFLFSGVRTFGDMGVHWAGYFVNAKTLKMSFLQPAEAYHLVTQPVPNFPSQELFSEGVVEEIIQMTGAHPFLLQAVCSELIDNLNGENREQATIDDVNTAVICVLDNWWDTYFRDLWERTNQQQRACLKSMSSGEKCDIRALAQQNSFDEQVLQEALQTLLKRDLVRVDQHSYRIAASIFCKWVERNL